MAFHTDMASLLAWLDDAETRLAKLPSLESLKVLVPPFIGFLF